MTRKTWIVLAALLAMLAGVQHLGLERRPEIVAENKLKKLPQVSAGDMLPTYVASLFFGAFRAVAIDVLWIQLAKVEEERRWYERREILKMISYVQPRNPEVWSHLGWHSAYNVANGFTDGKKQWDWIRFGLTWLRQGIRMIPDNVLLKFELAITLQHKPSWRDVELDLPLLKQIESDPELQRELLPDDVAPDGRIRSAFELARLWLERARDEIQRLGIRAHKTQMGLLIYQSSLDGYIRRSFYLEAVRAWQEGDPAKAVDRVRAAEAHVRGMLGRTYPEYLPAIFKDWAEFYATLPPVIELHAKALRTGAAADERAALKALQELVAGNPLPLDEGFLWSRNHPGALLNMMKRKIAGGRDAFECNDGLRLGSDLAPGTPAAATIAPEGLDVDWYWLRADPPGKRLQGMPEPKAPPTLRLKISFSRPDGAAQDLKATVLDTHQRELTVLEVRGKAALTVPVAEYGTYYLKVEPLDSAAPAPADTRYSLTYSLEP
jgi:hypothetical protein